MFPFWLPYGKNATNFHFHFNFFNTFTIGSKIPFTVLTALGPSTKSRVPNCIFPKVLKFMLIPAKRTIFARKFFYFFKNQSNQRNVHSLFSARLIWTCRKYSISMVKIQFGALESALWPRSVLTYQRKILVQTFFLNLDCNKSKYHSLLSFSKL